jgi:Flavin reductase like domain
VSLLSEAQRDVSDRFVRKRNDRFAGLEIICSDTGLPMLAGALAYFCCKVRSVHEGGDHDIIVAEVHACRQRSGQPLGFYRGAYVGVSIVPVINGTRARGNGDPIRIRSPRESAVGALSGCAPRSRQHGV